LKEIEEIDKQLKKLEKELKAVETELQRWKEYVLNAELIKESFEDELPPSLTFPEFFHIIMDDLKLKCI